MEGFCIRGQFCRRDQRLENLIPHYTSDENCIIDEFIHLGFFLFSQIPDGRLVAIFHDIAFGILRHLTEFVLQIADLCGAKGIIGSSEHDGICPEIDAIVRLVDSVGKALTILANDRLSDVNNIITVSIAAKEHKKFFEQHFRLHNKLTIYSKDGIKLTITKEPHYHLEGGHSKLDLMDLDDLTEFANMMALRTTPDC